MTKKRVVYFILGIIATAVVWWTTESLLDRHVGPKVGL